MEQKPPFELTRVDNQMQMLRHFAVAASNGPISLNAKDSLRLAKAINAGLDVIDNMWEVAAGRKLTHAEKWGTDDDR